MSARKLPPREVLIDMYLNQKLSSGAIARQFGASANSVMYQLAQSGVQMRNLSEANKIASPSRPRRPRTKSTLKPVVRCRGCGWVWKYIGNIGRPPCPLCGKLCEARKRPAPANRRGKPVTRRTTPAQAYAKLRRSVLMLVGRGKIECVKCGCNDARLLEVNHINGGGAKEFKKHKSTSKVYHSIVRLERGVDDLDLRCRVCNALHWLELKFGDLPFSVTYTKPVGDNDVRG